MASGNAVWGIDIGQCALKALRCTIDENDQMVAEAFDFIEYPKMLSQPEADADELIREALEQFLERNEIKGDRIAMSVSGQAGLARFFKPPPVDAKVLPDIVKYEARQQIPFAIEDVIWDYQQMGGVEVDGFTLDADVGLFAMKREQVFRALKPFTDAEVEVDIVQLSPLCIYNFVTHDLLGDMPAPEEVDPDNPPESVVVLAMGTETTDLVITNGSKLWQRSIPLGGNHFTKHLTKDLKLTFAKAEHVKRNARQAEDPKKIFQAMRPVFNDLVTEIQRSISYFQSIDRQAKVGRLVMLGNAVKLPGLRQYLEKNLGQEIVRISRFSKLGGSEVIAAPAFKDNMLSFSGCYGLCLQGLGEAKLRTNLLPREFITVRRIREKKPWAVAAVGAMLLAFTVNFAFCFYAWQKVHADFSSVVYYTPESDGTEKPVQSNMPGAQSKRISWKDVESKVMSLQSTSNQYMTRDTDQMADFKHVSAVGQEVIGNADRRLLWLELLRAINESLPKDPRNAENEILDPEIVPYVDRLELQIEHVESEYYPDLKVWFNDEVRRLYSQDLLTIEEEQVEEQPAAEPAADEVADAPAPAPPAPEPPPAEPLPSGQPGSNGQQGEVPEIPGPVGPGWVIELKGIHYHNSSDSVRSDTAGPNYVRKTLLKNLREAKVWLPEDPSDPANPSLTGFSLKELGIGFAIIADQKTELRNRIPNPNAKRPATSSSLDTFGTIPSTTAATEEPEKEISEFFDAPKFSFRVQFCWQEKRLSERLAERGRKRNGTTKRRSGAGSRRIGSDRRRRQPRHDRCGGPAGSLIRGMNKRWTK